MFDLALIRENPGAFDAALARRGTDPIAQEILTLDEQRRALMTDMQADQARRNDASRQIGQAMKDGDKDKAEALKAETSQLKEKLQAMEEEERKLGEALEAMLLRIPNLPLDDVPDGKDEADNQLVRTIGEPRDYDFEVREHFDLGEALGQMDFEAAAALSGSRFVVLKGALARLERAIGQFMINLQTMENGYTEVATPALVRDEAMIGTGQLPKFAEDSFKTGDYWLIPTAEVTLTNLWREQILEEESLPRRYSALTPCFRAEAGAAGRDTRGMIRQHQFQKVEMVSVVTPEQGEDELERMLGCAESVLKALDLPYQVVQLCTGDMGFSARKTYDIEVWLPGQGRYREISSCSLCGDFQARRMKMRCRPRSEKKTRFPFTLNGSGLAVGRTLIAVMENYQQADGSIAVPEVLQPYMGGQTVIEKA